MRIVRYLVPLLLVFGWVVAQETPPLTSVPAPYAPLIDGMASEPFWAEAPVLDMLTEGQGFWEAANSSETTVQIQSVYSGDSIYFLLKWPDPTNSMDRQRWVFDGETWTQQDRVPLSEGGASVNYEDKLAFLWVIDAPEVVLDETFRPTYLDEEEGPEYGYDRPVKSAEEGELLDMWHFKYVRTNFTNPSQVDDQYLDDQRDPETSRNAGRHSDPQGEVAGGYFNSVGEFTAPDGTVVNGPTYYVPGNPNVFIITQGMIDRGEALQITSYEELMGFAPGTVLPGIIGRPLTGSRGDISGKATWRDGWYYLEIGRALDTGDPEHDVIFGDLDATYYFGVGTFDNTQIEHAVSDVYPLVFSK